MSLDLYKYIYLIGVGGIGMSALARYFNAKGKMVYGYDQFKSDLSVELENDGVNIEYMDDISIIPELIRNSRRNDLLVVYTPAIPEKNHILSFFRNKTQCD